MSKFDDARRSLRELLDRVTAALRPSQRRLDEVLRRVDLDEVKEQQKRYRAALNHPADEKSQPWIEAGWMTPKDLKPFWRFFPDPLKRRGRPKGSAPVAGNKALLAAMGEHITATGDTPTTAARKVLKAHGVTGELKGKADHLKKIWEAANSRKK
jgi:hypothetical protein